MKLYSILFLLLMVGEQPITGKQIETNILKVKTGLDILVSEKFDLINGNNIGLVTNQSGINYNSIPNVRLFMELDHVHFKEIFAPEHGFFGNISAGQSIDEQKPDEFTTIYSLYGNSSRGRNSHNNSRPS